MEVQDITKVIELAIDSGIDWRFEEFQKVRDEMMSIGLSIGEYEDGENWCSLGKEGRVAGYLWVKHPLLIVENEYFPSVEELLKNKTYLNVIAVDSLQQRSLKITAQPLQEFFQSTINFHAFSAEELWFNTVV